MAMILSVLLALALGGAAVALAARAAAVPRVRVVERLEGIGAYGFVEPAPAAANARGLLPQVADRLGARLASRLPQDRQDSLRQMLLGAGYYQTEVRTFLGYRALATLALGAVLLWLALAAGFAVVLTMLTVVYAVAVGWVAPLLVVRHRSRARLAEIDYRMPELVDLLIVTVEAGGGLSGALRLAAERLKGPLAEELRLTQQEESLGLSSHQALDNMLSRCETPSIRAFVRSIRQGESLGVSIGTILRNLNTDMRKRRRQNVEERAQKAPIKMLFPLVFLIFPAMFIVLLFPAVSNFMTAFGGM